MENAVGGFLSREDFHLPHNLGTRRFRFDAEEDLFRAAGNDPGLFSTGHDLIQTFRPTHRKAVLILDAEWAGSPGAMAIREDLTERILKTGWHVDSFRVIVICHRALQNQPLMGASEPATPCG